MKLPSAEEYLQIIDKKNSGSLATLRHHRFMLREDGRTYWYKQSRHAIVFKTEFNSKFHAVRFFLNDDAELFRRYNEIQNFLESKTFSWIVPFYFLNEEFYPAVNVDWIDSFSFTDYLDKIITDTSRISQLQLKLIALSRNLEENGIGHGNLNMNHIRVLKQDRDITLKLIDYDSMFIPSLKGKDSLSTGTSSFQHPMRLTSDFSETIDRFSFWIFLTALEAFKTDATLWTKASEYGYDKQVLFNYKDLAIPQQSGIFQTLKNYNHAALDFYADKLIQFCSLKSLGKIEAPQLYESNPYTPKRMDRPIRETRIPSETVKEKKTEQLPAVQLSPPREQKTILPGKPVIKRKTIEERRNEFIHLRVQERGHRRFILKEKNKKSRLLILAGVAAALILAFIYFPGAQNHIAENSSSIIAAPQKKTIQPLQEPVPKETVFTSANITQFLVQLYQSYNKRDLQAILSNYADTLGKYYDAGTVTKDKLNDIINNLFISPVYYECRPDMGTLQFTMQDNVCKLIIGINETIKATKRSKKENYSSKIEYTIDRSFKILREENIE